MATILSNKKSTYGGPYAFYTVGVTVGTRTPTTVKIKFTVTARLQYSTSWIGTGSGYGLTASLYIGGAWRTITLKSEQTRWQGTGAHSVTSGWITISAGTATSVLSGIRFKVDRTGSGTSAELTSTACSNVGITNVSNTYSGAKLTATANSQAQITAALSGLPAAVGYARTIKWYIGGVHAATTSISATSKVTSYSQVFKGLLPNNTYDIKAIVYYSNTALITKTAAATTPQETGALTITPQSTYMTLAVKNMFNAPNYNRSIEFYYKKSSASDYILAATMREQGTTVTANITGLISNVKYDFRVIVKNGDIALVALTGTATTIKDTGLVPKPAISGLTQQLGTRNCTISWIVDKSVAGTTYKILAKAEGESAWTQLTELTAVTSPVIVVSHAGNKNVQFKITANNESVASGVTNESAVYTFYVRDDFVWDQPKTAGQPMAITAAEWNRLREYVVARRKNEGVAAANIPVVRKGDRITAATYNTMKNAISEINTISIANKSAGDVIKAADIDALRVAINKTGS